MSAPKEKWGDATGPSAVFVNELAGSDLIKNTILDITSDIGLNRTILKNELTEKAINDPSKYLNDQKDALKAIRKLIVSRFTDEYTRLVSFGISPLEAKILATKVARQLGESEMMLFKIQYPSSAISTAISGEVQNNNGKSREILSQLNRNDIDMKEILGPISEDYTNRIRQREATRSTRAKQAGKGKGRNKY